MSTQVPDERPGASNIARWDVNPALVEMQAIGNNRRGNGALGLLIVLCLTGDFLMMPTLSSIQGPQSFVEFLGVLGCVLAQGNLLAAWLAWSEGPFMTRLMRHWAIAALLYLIWVAGFAVAGVSQFRQISMLVGLSVPVVSLAAQTPLWIARQSFGWRLIRGEGEGASSRAPLTIRRLMIATLVVASSFGVARLAPSPDKGPMWPLWAFAFVAAGSFSTLAILPAGAMLMRTRELRRGLMFAGLYAGSYVAILWLAGFTVHHFGWFLLPPPPIFVGISGLIFSFATTVMLAAVVARLRGYRLVWGRPPKPGQLSLSPRPIPTPPRVELE